MNRLCEQFEEYDNKLYQKDIIYCIIILYQKN